MSFSQLPLETKENIGLNLSYPELLNLCKTSNEYNQICNDDNFWKRKFLRDFLGSQNLSWKVLYQKFYTSFNPIQFTYTVYSPIYYDIRSNDIYTPTPIILYNTRDYIVKYLLAVRDSIKLDQSDRTFSSLVYGAWKFSNIIEDSSSDKIILEIIIIPNTTNLIGGGQCSRFAGNFMKELSVKEYSHHKDLDNNFRLTLSEQAYENLDITTINKFMEELMHGFFSCVGYLRSQ
jgi:hypothetical protein